MKTVKKNKEIILHSLMCSVGGLLAGYAILCRGNLGSAQTLNLIDIMLGIVGRNREEVIFRVFGAVIYILGIESYILIKEKTKINLRRYSVVTDMAGCVLLAFIPPEAGARGGYHAAFLHSFDTVERVSRNARPQRLNSVFDE